MQMANSFSSNKSIKLAFNQQAYKYQYQSIIMDTTPAETTSLTKLQRWNIASLLVAWSCVVCSLTIVVGNSAVLVQAVGGSSQIAPFSLATFFVGMSSVSLLLTHWMFDRWGRKVGFWIGIAFGVLGSVLGVLGVLMSSPLLVILANAPLGAGSGIGMYVRFASMEVVPPSFHARAVTWVLLGGCISAFLGPEVAQASTEMDWAAIFDRDEHHTNDFKFTGVFCVTALFNMIEGIFVSLVSFPQPKVAKEEPSIGDSPHSSHKYALSVDENKDEQNTSSLDEVSLRSILMHSSFWLPMLIAAIHWSVMAMPMGLVRIVMKELGYSNRQSLTVIEVHFCSMYGPGLISGPYISSNGPLRACWVSVAAYTLAVVANFTATSDTSKTIYITPFYIGLSLLGIGWNFGFSATTVWVSKIYQPKQQVAAVSDDKPEDGEPSSDEEQQSQEQPKVLAPNNPLVRYKSKIQAANECGMFFLSGCSIFSTGYIYEAGGSGIEGWRTLQYLIIGLLGLMAFLLGTAHRMSTSDSQR